MCLPILERNGKKMKKNVLVIILLFVSFNLFATPLIEAARNQDYKTFEKLVNEGASLNEINESGMNLQLALAYFNEKDFKKACKLLSNKGFDFDVPVKNNISLLYVLCYSCSYKKISTLLNYNIDINRRNSITNLKPIDATQFSTFKFYSEQKINALNSINAKKTRELLIKNGSEDFKLCETTMGNIGNMFFCMFNIIGNIYPVVTPQMVNSSELFNFSEIDGQQIVTLRQDKMKELFNSLNLDVEINNYFETDKILEQLIETETSEDLYSLIAFTGNNPIAPFQCVNISSSSLSINPSETKILKVANPDALYQFVDFQVKDLTHLITIKFKNME
jgi:hypothetical protein